MRSGRSRAKVKQTLAARTKSSDNSSYATKESSTAGASWPLAVRTLIKLHHSGQGWEVKQDEEELSGLLLILMGCAWNCCCCWEELMGERGDIWA